MANLIPYFQPESICDQCNDWNKNVFYIWKRFIIFLDKIEMKGSLISILYAHTINLALIWTNLCYGVAKKKLKISKKYFSETLSIVVLFVDKNKLLLFNQLYNIEFKLFFEYPDIHVHYFYPRLGCIQTIFLYAILINISNKNNSATVGHSFWKSLIWSFFKRCFRSNDSVRYVNSEQSIILWYRSWFAFRILLQVVHSSALFSMTLIWHELSGFRVGNY